MNNKITQEELQQIQGLNDKYNQSLYNLGIIQYQINFLENEIEKEKEERKNILGDINTIKNQTQEFLQVIENKYGKVSIDISTGEIT